MKVSSLILRCTGVVKTCRYNSTAAVVKAEGHYDIVISGGGMVGFAMACSLGKNELLANKRILLLESSTRKQLNLEAYNHRVCALNPGSKSFLQTLGAWQHIEKARYGSVKNMQVWDACSDAAIMFGKADLSEDVAWVVENDLVLDSIMQEVDQLSQIEVQYKTKATNYKLPQNSEEPAQVTLEDGSSLTTDLIIGADGYNSGLRRAMKSQYITYDYNQMGVVATLRIAESEANVTAWQRFLPTGPIALLPLNNELSSLVWSTDKVTAKCLLELPTEMFTDRINQALVRVDFHKQLATVAYQRMCRLRVGWLREFPVAQPFKYTFLYWQWNDEDRNPVAQNVSERVFQMLKVCRINSQNDLTDVRQLPPSVVEVQGRPAAFPLGLGHSVDYVSNRAVLIGDAAHRVHPLAGQGVNLGFGDVVALKDVICEAINNGSDHGSLLYLKEYQSKRQLHNLPIMATVHGLHLLYGTTWTPAVLMRSIGLNLFDSLSTVKSLITQRASA